MDSITNFLLDYGYWGMLVAAFLAGSFFPFSSEAVMLGLLAMGLKPVPLVVYGTIGNVGGSMFNYYIGSLGKIEWIEKYLHVKKSSLEKAEKFMDGWGSSPFCHSSAQPLPYSLATAGPTRRYHSCQ